MRGRTPQIGDRVALIEGIPDYPLTLCQGAVGTVVNIDESAFTHRTRYWVEWDSNDVHIALYETDDFMVLR